MMKRDRGSLLEYGKSRPNNRNYKKSEEVAWMLKTSFLASFMTLWVVAPFAILFLPDYVPQALTISFVTSWIVTPVVSSQLITNLVKLLKEQRELTHMAQHDGMTGLMNRTFFLDQLKILQQDCLRADEKFGIITVDIDHFKQINDQFGHAIGDEVIIGFSKLMLDLAPNDAIVGRTGGEEFTIGIRSNHLEIERFVRALCETTQKMNFSDTGATISAGFIMGSHENCIDLRVRADAALYSAKDAGRNCYRMAA